MRLSLLSALAALAGLPLCSASPLQLAVRAEPDAPDGYVPSNVTCPSPLPSLRRASGLSPQETAWLRRRRPQAADSLQSFLRHATIPNFDAAGFVQRLANSSNNSADAPNIAVGLSGGGYRAMLTGAGVLEAFDGRVHNATTSGHLGGLLQASTYVAGLSGGSWAVGSIFLNNFTTVQQLQRPARGSSVWELSRSVFQGPAPHGVHPLDTTRYYNDLRDQLDAKRDAGYELSLTDLWGRALAWQMIDAPDGGLSYTWSSIANTSNIRDGSIPLPLIVADSRLPGERLVLGNSTIFEFSPWEFGTFDASIYGFAPLEYVGSPFNNGNLNSSRRCVRGFDNAGYVMGSSATLFNEFLLNLNSLHLPRVANDLISDILGHIGRENDDIAPYTPNPFYNYTVQTNPFNNTDRLTVVDGGEDGQNIALHPLIQPERQVDVVIAVDASADTPTYFPNGTSLVASYERSIRDPRISNGTAFPPVPAQNTFVNRGFNERPTFFGCNASNFSSSASLPPLVVYLPNAPYTYNSNQSTFKLSYSTEERDNMVFNGYHVGTMGNGTVDRNWPTCLSCAILSRSFHRTNTTVPAACKSCFARYCWDGRSNDTTPNTYEPAYIIGRENVDAAPALVARGAFKMGALVAAMVTLRALL